MWNVKKVQQPIWQGSSVENWPEQPITLENCQMVCYHPPLPTFKCYPNLCIINMEGPISHI